MKTWLMSIKAAVLCAAVVLTPSCGQQTNGPVINGISGPTFNVLDGKIIMTIKFHNLYLDGGATLPIPETRDSTVSLMPNVLEGGTILSMSMSPAELGNLNVDMHDGNTLPDGRPLPGIAGGRLENSYRVDTRIAKKDVSFYYHKTLFGIWMPFGFDSAGISGYFNINMSGKSVGFIGLVGNEPATGRTAGGVVLLRLDNLKNKQLKKVINLSKRNPHLMY